MKRTKRKSRPKTGQAVVSILGIELFADTQILRIAIIGAHFQAVGDVDFPLADLDQPDAPNATVMIMFFRLHPGEPMTGAVLFHFHHRDSISPDYGLDLNRLYYCDTQVDPDMMIAESTAFLPTVGTPTILDVSHLNVVEAFEAFARTLAVIVKARDEATTDER